VMGGVSGRKKKRTRGGVTNCQYADGRVFVGFCDTSRAKP